MGKKIAIVLSSFFTVLIIAYLVVVFYYSRHILPNTSMSGIDLSNLTAEETENNISKLLDGYSLTVTGRDDINEVITRDEIGLRYLTEGYGDEVIGHQNYFLWFMALFNDSQLTADFDITYDEDKLEKAISDHLFIGKNSVAPEDAYLADYKSGEGFVIVPEVMGSTINREALNNKIIDAILNMDESFDIDANDCYVNPTVFSDDKKLVKRAKYLNKFTDTNIVYHFGKEDVVIDGDQMYEWMTIKKNGKVELDEEAIRKFAYDLGTKYDTIFRSRTFKTHYGTEITIEGGDYGWWMNRPATQDALVEAVKACKQCEMEPVYFQKAAKYGAKDIGSTYVEVNLTAQHLYVYKKGKVVLESDFVSGKDTKERKTPTGVYGITYKERDATLVGADYETPVSYWMPFNGSVGLHDATWRNQFGASIYKANGSHGCINLPFYVAEKIYGIVEKGTAVVCYELPGTESSHTTAQGDAEIAQFVIDAIDRIVPTTSANKVKQKEFFERIRKCYSELSGGQRSYVKNLSKLDEAEKKLREFK